MATKNNIRSIRFSDEMAELIDRQAGSSFTEKFENLVTRCVWELPAKEKELERLEKLIRKKREQYQKMERDYASLESSLNGLTLMADNLRRELSKAIKKI